MKLFGYATLKAKEVLKNELVLLVAVVMVPAWSVTVHVKAYPVKVVALVTVRVRVTPLIPPGASALLTLCSESRREAVGLRLS